MPIRAGVQRVPRTPKQGAAAPYFNDKVWESRVNAIRPLKQNLKDVIIALSDLIQDPTRILKLTMQLNLW